MKSHSTPYLSIAPPTLLLSTLSLAAFLILSYLLQILLIYNAFTYNFCRRLISQYIADHAILRLVIVLKMVIRRPAIELIVSLTYSCVLCSKQEILRFSLMIFFQMPVAIGSHWNQAASICYLYYWTKIKELRTSFK